ncbi:MAG: hypothetical protein AAGI48_06345 [Verrucomicrobiota bacterium]
MSRVALTGILLALLMPVLRAQAVAPPAVVDSAVTAVEDLGEKVVKRGDFKAAIDSMYPQWKERMAKRNGGIRNLEEKLAAVGPALAREGVEIISFKTVGAPRSYEVWPGKPEPGAAPDAINFTKWLLLIPTVTQLRVAVSADPPEFAVIDSHGFQVAISDKGKNEWTFINGSDVTVADLRSLFITLPDNMRLPEVKKKVAD